MRTLLLIGNLTITVEASSTRDAWTPIARSTAGTAFTPLIAGVQCVETHLGAGRLSVTITDAPSTSEMIQDLQKLHSVLEAQRELPPNTRPKTNFVKKPVLLE